MKGLHPSAPSCKLHEFAFKFKKMKKRWVVQGEGVGEGRGNRKGEGGFKVWSYDSLVDNLMQEILAMRTSPRNFRTQTRTYNYSPIHKH